MDEPISSVLIIDDLGQLVSDLPRNAPRVDVAMVPTELESRPHAELEGRVRALIAARTRLVQQGRCAVAGETAADAGARAEMDTPKQAVSDPITSLNDALSDVLALVDRYQRLPSAKE